MMSTTMSPDHDSRLRRLERYQAAADERLTGINDRVRDLAEALSPLALDVATLTERTSGIVDDVAGANRRLGELTQALEARDNTASAERKAVRTAIISLVSALSVAFVTTVGGVLVVLLQ